MAKKYDFLKAKQIIENEQDELISASLGMYEDWAWTAVEVWEEGKFTENLTQVETIAGIDGSTWATPVVRLEYKDGSEEVFYCYTGKSSGSRPFGSMLTSGPFSSAAQANMPIAKEYEKSPHGNADL